MTNIIETVFPNLIHEQSVHVSDEVSSEKSQEAIKNPEPEEIKSEDIPVVSEEIIDTDSSPLPPPANEVITSIKTSGDSFLNWAFDTVIPFLDLADLERIKTAEAMRGIKEDKIRDKIQMANSVLVLLANYGSEMDNQPLVSACELYAAKMQTIIKRLCL